MGDATEDECGGPYTCCQCLAPTWNDDDWCDNCTAQAQRELDEIDFDEGPTP